MDADIRVVSWLLFAVCWSLYIHGGRCSVVDCPRDHIFSTGGYDVDLSSLKGVWQTVYIEGTDIHSDITVPRFYNISLFDIFQSDQCKGNHICYTETFDAFHVLGKGGSCKYSSENKIISLVYEYEQGVFGAGNVTINLICGSNLGVPEVLEGDPRNRVVEMMWITSAACKHTSDKTPLETKCYNLKHSIDRDNGIEAEFVDLTGLIQDAGYEATMAERPDVIMNVSVCQPMKSDDACDGSNICLYHGDSNLDVTTPLPLGFITAESINESTPHYDSGVLTAVFPTKKDNVDCSGSSPFVKVRFFCPTGDEVLGPYIEYLDNDLCVVIIVWNTMHACDLTSIQSNDLTLTTHQDRSFDLRGLPEITIIDKEDTKTYFYTIHPSATGNLNAGCQDDNTSPIRVTQTENGTAVCRSLGEGQGKLRYVDNVLTLTYTNGDTCHDGFARTSIITFVCPNDIVGSSVRCDAANASKCASFNFETHCLYEFEWVTDVACGNSDASSSLCRFKLDDVDYNLGLLTEDYRSTYAAIVTKNEDTECYLINPCGNIEVTAQANLTSAHYCNERVGPQESCDQTSVCRISRSGKSESLGTFHLDQSSLLHSVVKDVVSVATQPTQTKSQAVVHYICQTGTLLTSPVFISHEVDSIAEFHWYTFAACPQGVSVGSECLVTQPSTGFTFNLTSLSNTIFNFTDSINHFNYSVSICNNFRDNTFSGTCSSNSAVCQHSATSHISAGQKNTTLIYADSAIKLYYNNGKKCSSNDTRHTAIVFLCNPNVHTATIQNVTEIKHCSYVVEMETKLACPPAYRSAECVYFSSNGDSYDLTQLEKTNGNWQAEGSDGSVYLINICRPLDLKGVGQCNPLSAVCRTGSSAPAVDLGLASTASFGSPPQSTDNHVAVVLNYTYPSSSDDGCSMIYTSIQFVCNRTAPINAGPRHLSGGGSTNPCEYMFLWETRMACPIKPNVAKKACNITDSLTGYNFDLAPLKKHHNNRYTVVGSDNYNYTITLCDVLGQSNCKGDGTSVCQSNSKHHYSIGKYTSMELSYIDGSLTLFYKGGDNCTNGDLRTTEIGFLCDRLAGDDYFGQPKFVSESSHCHYLFEWATPLACPPAELSCVAGGGKYNLKPLMEKRNWFVSGGNNGQLYVIGGCQAIDSSSIPQCAPSVDVGACLYTPTSNKTNGEVLGYLTGDLVEVSEGHLKLSYHNGKMCPDEGLRSVVNIHYHCKPQGGAGSPVLESSSGCVTEITWDTQYACAQDNTSTGWIITNPSTGQTFDLTKLPNTLTAEYNGYTYTVGLVGHTVPCGDKENVMICQRSNSSGNTHAVARKEGQITLELVGGKVQFTTQNGDKCHHHNQINRKATVYFEYDPRDDYLMVLPEQGCEYSFVVFTKLVHEDKQEIGTQCYVDNFPDLKWFTTYPTPPLLVESGSAKVYFSVCSPLSSGNQEDDGYNTCDAVSGACYVKGSKVFNLGRPTTHYPPVVSPDGNAVQITYVGGDTCSHTHKKFTTKILLVCSNKTGSVPEVTYFNMTSCEAIIIWRSPHACPLLVPITPVSDSVCSITDPSDGTVLNLQPLTDGGQVTSTDGNYVIGLCGPIDKGADSCIGNHAGICHHHDNDWMKMTDANHTLTLVSHSPHALDIQYTSGESCDGHVTWKVNLHIYCSNKNNSKQPYLESSSGCDIRFIWPTSTLCLTEVEGCYISYPDNTILDLEPLMSHSWEGATADEDQKLGEFNVSVCRNLNPTIGEGSGCYPGPAGICYQPDVSSSVYKNLGYMSSPPTLTDNGEIVLQYAKGDACGTNNNMSTTVYLKCPVTEFNSPPQMRAMTDVCHYEIDWSTEVACKHNKEKTESCILNTTHSGVQYDFTPLANQYTFTDDSTSYSVCLCPKHNGCSTGIRNTTGDSDVNLGTFHQLIVYPNSGPQFDFINGDSCPGNNHYSSTVMMFCDRGIKSEKGRFVYEKGLSIDCHKFFTWWTPVACTTPELSCVIQKPFYDFTPIYPPNGSWIATGTEKNEEYLINICGPIHVAGGSSIGCSGNTAVCHKKSDGSYHDLAFASTQTITINSNGHPEVHFSSPEKCSNDRYSSVVIEMICGLEGLKFHKKENCVYRFNWHTTYACQESEKPHTQNNCNSYVDSNKLYTFLPGELRKDGGYHALSNTRGMYHVNLCGDESINCGDGIAVCHVHTGGSYQLGTLDSMSVTFDSYWMRFSMTGQDGNAVITVECADSEDTHSPNDLEKMTLENEFITTGNKRTVYLRMYTAKGCKFDESHVPSGGTTPPPSSPSPSDSKNGSSNRFMTALIIILLVVMLIVVMIATVVLWKKERRDYVYHKLSSFFSAKADEPVRYVRAKTNDTEASLLDESNSEEEPLAVNANINSSRQDGVSSNGADEGETKRSKKQKKKKDKPLVTEYKDEEESHLSDEELLNL